MHREIEQLMVDGTAEAYTQLQRQGGRGKERYGLEFVSVLRTSEISYFSSARKQIRG